MSQHVASKGMYYGIFLALMVLTAITVGMDYIDLGSMNLVIAMLVAVVKATLVVLFFMHLYWSSRITHVTFVSAFVFFAILIVFTLSDVFTRGMVGVAGR